MIYLQQPNNIKYLNSNLDNLKGYLSSSFLKTKFKKI